MSKGLIYIDIDGVVLDSVSGILKARSIIDGVDYTKQVVKKWNMTDAIPHLTDRGVESLFASDLFWREVKFIKGAKEFITKHQNRTVVCSMGDYRNQLKKIEFLNKHFHNISMLPVISTVNTDRIIGKHLIRMTENDVFIEDSASNLNTNFAGLNVLFNDKGDFDCEWNKNILVNHSKATNYLEIRKLVEEFDNK